tara:strand:- start:137 stop:385 length:249 start_codon:yes stop_codon:yes gene_type:complete
MQLQKLLNEAIQVTKDEMGKSAEIVYKKRRADIEKQIRVLPKALKTIDALQKRNPTSWNYAGTLGKIKKDIEDIIYFVNNQQ